MVWKTTVAMMRMKRRRVSRGPSHIQVEIGYPPVGTGANNCYEAFDPLYHLHSSFALETHGWWVVAFEGLYSLVLPSHQSCLLPAAVELEESSARQQGGACGSARSLSQYVPGKAT